MDWKRETSIGVVSTDGVWRIGSRPQGGYNIFQNGRFVASAPTVAAARILAEDIAEGKC